MAVAVDPRRFEELTQPLLDVLYRVALRFTRSREDAEDLVQETMLKAFRAFDRFEEGTSLRAWMLRILTNSYYNKYRRRVHERRAADLPADDPYHDGLVSDSSLEYLREPEAAMQRPILSEEIGRAIDRLPEGFRSVFALTEIEGFTYREAAEALAVPIGTVMSRLHRARKLLQQDLLAGESWEQSGAGEGWKGEDGAAAEGGPEGEVVPLRTAR
ncbi:MAG: sigma-70 family RNA polymerase sigma factor [Deltaproteobacteria bacterium]|nr:sigma-70 family RNA polymerase sigma factor [Deltaproteobacteria bacterium]